MRHSSQSIRHWVPSRRGRRVVIVWLAVMVGLATRAVGSAIETPGLRIGAAASVASVVESIAAERAIEATISVAASGVIATQTLAGAPFDIVVFTDPLWMDRLRDAGLVRAEDRRIVASNRLVVIRSRRADDRDDDRLTSGRGVVADPAASPLGERTREALTSLGWTSSLTDRTLRAEDAQATLRLVEIGEADWGVVYASDARTSDRVHVVHEIDAVHHRPITIEAALLVDDPDARRFFAAVTGEAGRARWASAGFAVPDDVGDAETGDRTGREADDATMPWRAVVISLKVATVAVVAMLPPGIWIAWWLARSRSRWTSVIEAVVALPLVLPPVVVGYVLLRMLGRQGVLGSVLHDHLGIDVAFTWWAAAIASGIMGLPLLVRSARLGFESVDPDLERAAANAGAGRWRTFRRVTLPLAMPGVVAGATLAFARCLGEFGATIVVAGNLPGETRTLALAIWTESRTPGNDERIALLVIVAIALSVVATVVSEWLLRRWRIR